MSKKTTSPDESELAQSARSSMGRPLPGDVQRKLRLARAEAVAQLENTDSLVATVFGKGRWLLPLGSVAAIWLAVSINQDRNTVPLMPVFNEQELAAATDMDVLEEIELKAWMMEQSEEGVPDDG